ncbi:MAG TPA: hypothetical protein VMJ12_11405 [Candidatus Acidoferrales bacterium]|nr:hypothetical protein [Candidatus Acidoferrales bacterium]
MKKTILACLIIAPATALMLTGCSSSDSAQVEGSTVVSAQPGVPGGVMINTYQMTATVKSIDAETRKVTLVGSDGKDFVVKCGPNVVNFAQIQVGDQVTATVTDQLVVAMGTDASSQDNGAAAVVALAPVGAKPGGVVAQTAQITATITDINLDKHKVTLEFPDGSKKTVPVRPDVDLTQRKVGETVVINVTESVAIDVEKSQ